MRRTLEIENIEALRRLAGIDDVELHEQVRRLRSGDCVKLTVLAPDRPGAGAVVLVRITSIKGETFRGRVLSGTEPVRLPRQCVGSLVAFTPDHIHSVAGAPPGRGR
jgi:hypothetical protein